MLRALRILAAAAVFVGLNLFFLGFAEGTGGLARIQFAPACMAFNLVAVGAVAAVTMLAGRIYCSVACPLGVFQDIVLWLRKLFAKANFSYRPGRIVVRAACAAAFVVFALCGGAALAGVIEPYSVYGRFVTQLVRPALQWTFNLLAAWCEAHEKYWVMSDEVVVAGLLSFFVAAASIVAITVLTACAGRWYCNAVCPVGTLLSLVSKRPLMRIRIDASKCVRCGACVHVCKAACIDVKNMDIDNSRCVRCFNCLGVCRKGAVKL